MNKCSKREVENFKDRVVIHASFVQESQKEALIQILTKFIQEDTVMLEEIYKAEQAKKSDL